MRSLFLLIVTAALCLPAFATRIAVLPFSNSTTYKGNWFLEKDMASYIERDLAKTYSTVPSDSLFGYLKLQGQALTVATADKKMRVARRFKADFLLSGEITRFLVRKRIVGEGKYGGLKSYAAEITIKARVFSLAKNDIVFEEDINVERKDMNTAVNLGRLSKDEAQFDSLNTEKFGSQTFENSIAGAMMHEVCDKVRVLFQKLPEPVTRKGEEKKLFKVVKIVDINDKDIYINAGTDDEVLPGDQFNVFTKGDSIKDPETGAFLGVTDKFVGTVEVTEVKASHFSRARLITQKDSVRRMDQVRIEK